LRCADDDDDDDDDVADVLGLYNAMPTFRVGAPGGTGDTDVLLLLLLLRGGVTTTFIMTFSPSSPVGWARLRDSLVLHKHTDHIAITNLLRSLKLL
jgi:hypothetical protein